MSAIEYITIHNTGNYNTGANAEAHANYLYSGSAGATASWHYSVDKDCVWQSFTDTQSCWHTGNTQGNDRSVGIEICVNDKAGFRAACGIAAELTADLLRKHGLPLNRIVQHYYWTQKNCPEMLRTGAWGVTWNEFVNMADKYLKPPVPEQPPAAAAPKGALSEWAREAWQWAVSNDIVDGTRPADYSTREEVVTMIYRAMAKHPDV